MTHVIMRLVTRCTLAVFSILLGGFLLSAICDNYLATSSYASVTANYAHLIAVSSTHSTSNNQILTALPHALQLWTSITLAWGIFVCAIFCHLHHNSIWNRHSDVRINTFLWTYNIIISLFLMFGNKLAPGVSEPFIVFVLFYNSFLVIASTNIVHWWEYHMDNQPPIQTNSVPVQLNESPTQKLRRLQAVD